MSDPSNRLLRLELSVATQTPMINVDQDRLSATVSRGKEAQATLTIHNDGEGPLTLKNIETDVAW
eukprot:COSAG05_NODE_1584_length_4486_cov_402.617506_7_plen_65_part_00